MFEYLAGIVKAKNPTGLVLDVHGIGYRIQIPLSTFEVLPDVEKAFQVLIYFHVREDTQSLYGFASAEERDLFLMLISISGIGPKMAISIMSGATPQQFKKRIIAGDVRALTQIPGIGLKTAKRIIIELKEKFTDADEEIPGESEAALPRLSDEALQALLSLGYRRGESLTALKKAAGELASDASIEDIIKVALHKM